MHINERSADRLRRAALAAAVNTTGRLRRIGLAELTTGYGRFGRFVLAAHEHGAETIFTCAPGRVPALARTPAYHRWCLSFYDLPAKLVEASVADLAHRQRNMARSPSRQLIVHVDANALEDEPDYPGPIREQRAHLAWLSTRDNGVRVHLVRDIPELLRSIGEFTILVEPYATVAHADNALITGPGGVRPYLNAWACLRRNSVTDADSVRRALLDDRDSGRGRPKSVSRG
jgi:hypothetical protein